MKHIKIFDTTLRDGEQSPGCSMHINEKLEIAEYLDMLGVDIIEAGFPVISNGDFTAVQEIARNSKNSTIAGLCRSVKKDIDAAYEALKYAKKGRFHLFIATSPIHLKYKLNMSEEQVLSKIRESILYAKDRLAEIQFSFEDACRTPLKFLTQAAQTAVDAGATILNIPDTVGYITPGEIKKIFRHLKKHVTGIENIDLSTHNHDDLGMAVANSLAAVEGGATQIEGTFTGIGERAGNTALEEVIMAIKTRSRYYKGYTQIKTSNIYKTCRAVANVIGSRIPPNKAIIGANAFAHEAGIHQHGVLQEKSTYEIMSAEDIGITQNQLILGKHSGRHAFRDELTRMGYSYSDDIIDDCFVKFKKLADKKKNITRNDIEAILPTIIKHKAIKKYELEDYDINSYIGGASVSITLSDNGLSVSGKSTGHGPVDASFNAINNITSINCNLLDYKITAVTEGEDAQGETFVKLELDGITASGKGVSTDILESSVLAYINAINKLIERRG